jgi:hypothetical protein
MKRLYISLPETGQSEEEILRLRREITEKVTEALREYVIAIDFSPKHIPENTKPLQLLGEKIKTMATADYAYFGKNWLGSNACKIEHECAQLYNIKIICD